MWGYRLHSRAAGRLLEHIVQQPKRMPSFRQSSQNRDVITFCPKQKKPSSSLPARPPNPLPQVVGREGSSREEASPRCCVLTLGKHSRSRSSGSTATRGCEELSFAGSVYSSRTAPGRHLQAKAPLLGATTPLRETRVSLLWVHL